MANLTTSPPKNQTAAAFAALKPDFSASVLKKMHAWRDKGSYADEGLMIFSALLGLSSIFTLGIGYLLHKEFFAPFLGDFWATASAVVFTAFIEGAKIATALWALWMIVFGIFKRGLPSLFITILGLSLAVGAFMWSYHNSTTGVEKLVNQLATYKTPPTPFNGTAATAEIDAQIFEAQAAQNAALATKWRGTTTVDAMRTAKSIGKRLDELQSQRGLLLHQAVTEHATRTDNRNAFVDGAQFIASTLGGKMEWFQALILLAMVICYRAIWEHTKQQPTTDQHPAPAAAPPTLHTVTNGQNPYLNGTERRPIGFFQSPTAAVEHCQTVSDSPPDAQPNLFIAEPQKWRDRARQCHRRSLDTQASSTARRDNSKRRDLFLKALAIVGWKGEPTDDGEIIFERVPVQPAMTDEKRLKGIMLEINKIATPEPETA